MPVKRRIVFVPFPEDDAGDWGMSLDKGMGAGLTWDGSRYDYVWANEAGKKPFAFKDDTSDTQIYVVGHGGDGVLHIQNRDDAAARQVDAPGLVQLLIDAGLATAFSGSIKFYNCESATNNAGNDTSFACKCASLLVSNGYKHAHFFGYSTSVSTAYAKYLNPKTMDSEGEHKVALGPEIVLPGGQKLTNQLGRAKQFRNEIVVKMKRHLFKDNEFVAIIKR